MMLQQILLAIRQISSKFFVFQQQQQTALKQLPFNSYPQLRQMLTYRHVSGACLCRKCLNKCWPVFKILSKQPKQS